jgi:Flp pilus assembly pilin Flp
MMIKNRAIQHLLKNERGVAATEFALLLPVLLALLLGTYEMSRFIILNQKIERVAYTVSDVVAQQTSITTAQLNDILVAASKIMEPYEFGPNGRVIVTSVYQDVDDGATVRWQYEGGGTLDRDSRIGVVDGDAVLPGTLTLNDDDNIIIAEVFYNYVPTFTEDYFGTRENYKYAIFKPRFGALTTAPN